MHADVEILILTLIYLVFMLGFARLIEQDQIKSIVFWKEQYQDTHYKFLELVEIVHHTESSKLKPDKNGVAPEFDIKTKGDL